jgi:hypothetical protein
MNIYQKLEAVQKSLKAPKGQMNKFGGYRYRSCEDILEAVKPLLNGAVVTLSDTIREVGGRVYVEAEATFIDGENSVTVTAYAREAETKKGMDESQITGAASSYARKYALNGLFLIDDTKDADATNNGEQQDVSVALKGIQSAESLDALKAQFSAAYAMFKGDKSALAVLNEAKDARKKELTDV